MIYNNNNLIANLLMTKFGCGDSYDLHVLLMVNLYFGEDVTTYKIVYIGVVSVTNILKLFSA